ncbi:MAG: 16S rRNA (uracil(1498)-N(3))-methyltransferase [Epsilonproteobacteria bacterium]|nr:16S rRNA (uracil(1498)-N(3))-methyltransferase [Campylobacterota bacterium]
MQFIYHKDSSDEYLKIDGELHNYIFKVRRQDKDKNIFFRNLTDDFIYEYEVEYLDKKIATLHLISKEIKIVKPNKKLHIGWCKIDYKNIEKVIASLNEIGVDKITFIDCEYSQRNISINFDKLERLLHNSSSQSGRSDMITLTFSKNLDEFLTNYPNSYIFNFSDKNINDHKDAIETIVLGCEGGFSKKEIEKFSSDKIVGIGSDIIMRSETAILNIASKIL